MEGEDEIIQPPRAEVPLLQDINHYLESNGILQAHNQNYQRLDQVELAQSVNAQEQYQSKIIQKFINEDTEQEQNNPQHRELEKERTEVLRKCRDVFISIQTAKDVLKNVPLHHLVDRCDTFYTLASSDRWSSLTKDFKFSLDQFDTSSVKQFLAIVNPSNSFSVQDLTTQHIIDCCYISHFLQASEILNDIVQIIESSIDAENCTSICVMADELQIPSLLNSSMKFVMERLNEIQDNEELWDDIPTTLRNHILTLRNAAHSSIVGMGKKSQVIFSSAGEFLAIFHDTLTLNKERLREAKLRQEEIIQERMRENGHGRFSRRFVQQRDVYGGDVEDARVKIEKQEKRVQTLQAFYDQQKAIFSQDLQNEGRFKGPFRL